VEVAGDRIILGVRHSPCQQKISLDLNEKRLSKTLILLGDFARANIALQ